MAERDPAIEGELFAAAGKKRRLGRLALMASLPLLLAGGVAAWYVANDHYVATDNAYVRQDKVSVSAEVTGRIVEVGVRENQRIKAGDLLFRIDPEPFRIALAEADASIAAAQVNVVGMQTDYAVTSVDIASARENIRYQEQAFARASELMKRGFNTRERYDAAEYALTEARNRLATAQADAAKARAALATAPVAPGVNPAVLAAEVQKRRAAFNLGRTVVRAPIGGVVAQADRLLVGQTITQGLPAVSIVVDGASWIEANFKETDLTRMRIGQPAEIRFDTFPDMPLKGHVASIGAGTGSEFSMLPAQNANGNWVKVTQRVPVRIAIDDRPKRTLIAGLSTHVRIDTGR